MLMTKIEYRSKGQNHVYKEQNQTKQEQIAWTHTYKRPSHVKWYLTL